MYLVHVYIVILILWIDQNVNTLWINHDSWMTCSIRHSINYIRFKFQLNTYNTYIYIYMSIFLCYTYLSKSIIQINDFNFIFFNRIIADQQSIIVGGGESRDYPSGVWRMPYCADCNYLALWSCAMHFPPFWLNGTLVKKKKKLDG